MTECAALVFSGISVARFACLSAKARAQGININGDNGNASKDGITVSWDYHPVSQSLTLQCTSAPFFLNCESIDRTIHDLVDSCP
jgi:hypothetical protein